MRNKKGQFVKGSKLTEAAKKKLSDLNKSIGKRPPNMKGHKHSEATKKKYSEVAKKRKYSPETIEKLRVAKLGKTPWNKGKKIPQLSGSKNGSWKGGITPINTKLRNSVEYSLWRKSVFERDGYECIFGGKEHGSKLVADHIKKFADYPELRFAIDNGRTLCEECHLKTDTYGGRQPKTTTTGT